MQLICDWCEKLFDVTKEQCGKLKNYEGNIIYNYKCPHCRKISYNMYYWRELNKNENN